MEINYKNCSLVELYECRRDMDKESNPENYRKLLEATVDKLNVKLAEEKSEYTAGVSTTWLLFILIQMVGTFVLSILLAFPLLIIGKMSAGSDFTFSFLQQQIMGILVWLPVSYFAFYYLVSKLVRSRQSDKSARETTDTGETSG